MRIKTSRTFLLLFFFLFFSYCPFIKKESNQKPNSWTAGQLETIVTCFFKIHSIWWLSNLACFYCWSSPLIKGGALLLVVRNFSRASLRCVIIVVFFLRLPPIFLDTLSSVKILTLARFQI